MRSRRVNADLFVALFLIGSTCFLGCAGVKFVKEGEKTDLGFLYYPAKPYLVIEKGKEGHTVKLISLPDLSNPRFVKHKRGWGSSEFGFDTSNGMLTKFNAKSDSKGPETLTGIVTIGTAKAALMTAEAAKIAARAAVGDAAAGAIADATGDVPHPVLPLTKAYEDLQQNVLAKLPSPVGPELSAIRAEIVAIGNDLGGLKTVKYNPTTPKGLDDLVKKLAETKKEAKKIHARLAEQRKNLEDFLTAKDVATADKPKARAAAGGLDGVIATLSEFVQAAPSIEMYEILEVGGDIKLRRVQFTP